MDKVYLGLAVSVAMGLLGLITGYHKYYKTRRETLNDRRNEDIKGKLENNILVAKDLVATESIERDRLSQRLEGFKEETKDRIGTLESKLKEHDKKITFTQAHLMTEQKVVSLLEPIKKDVDDSRAELRDEIKELGQKLAAHQTHTEQYIHQLGRDMSEIKGYFKRMSEDK